MDLEVHCNTHIFTLVINVSEINITMSLVLHVLGLLYPNAWEDQRKPLVITKNMKRFVGLNFHIFHVFEKYLESYL